MNLLLIRKAVLTDSRHPDTGKTYDILIRDGVIARMAPNIEPVADAQVIEADAALISPGWMDIGVQTGDPGYDIGKTCYPPPMLLRQAALRP